MKKLVLFFCIFFAVSAYAGQKQHLQFILGLCRKNSCGDAIYAAL